MKGQIYWENSTYNFAPWAGLGEETRQLRDQQPALLRSDQQLMEEKLPHGVTFWYLNPVPVLIKYSEVQFVSLL